MSKLSNKVEKNIKINKSNMLFALVVFLSIVTFLNFFFDNDYMSLASIFVICISVLICDKNALIPISIYTSFFSYIFVFGPYNLYVFICAAIIVKICLIDKTNFKLALCFLPMFILIQILPNIDTLSFSVGELTALLPLALLLFCCRMYSYQGKKSCINAFACGYFISSALGFFKGYTRLNFMFDSNYVSSSSTVMVERFAGISYDPNFYTWISVIVLFLLFMDLIEIKSDVVWLGFVLFSVVCSAITYSKSMYLACIPIISLGIIKCFTGRLTYKIKFIKLLIVSSACFLLFKKAINRSLLLIWSRFDVSNSNSDFTTGRIDIWKKYIDDFVENPIELIFGHGFNASLNGIAAHNTFIELLYKYGIIIGFLLLLYFVICGKLMKYKFRLSYETLIIVITNVALISFLSAYTFYMFWTCTFMIMIIAQKKRESDEIVIDNSSCLQR